MWRAGTPKFSNEILVPIHSLVECVDSSTHVRSGIPRRRKCHQPRRDDPLLPHEHRPVHHPLRAAQRNRIVASRTQARPRPHARPWTGVAAHLPRRIDGLAERKDLASHAHGGSSATARHRGIARPAPKHPNTIRRLAAACSEAADPALIGVEARSEAGSPPFGVAEIRPDPPR